MSCVSVCLTLNARDSRALHLTHMSPRLDKALPYITLSSTLTLQARWNAYVCVCVVWESAAPPSDTLGQREHHTPHRPASHSDRELVNEQDNFCCADTVRDPEQSTAGNVGWFYWRMKFENELQAWDAWRLSLGRPSRFPCVRVAGCIFISTSIGRNVEIQNQLNKHIGINEHILQWVFWQKYLHISRRCTLDDDIDVEAR